MGIFSVFKRGLQIANAVLGNGEQLKGVRGGKRCASDRCCGFKIHGGIKKDKAASVLTVIARSGKVTFLPKDQQPLSARAVPQIANVLFLLGGKTSPRGNGHR